MYAIHTRLKISRYYSSRIVFISPNPCFFRPNTSLWHNILPLNTVNSKPTYVTRELVCCLLVFLIMRKFIKIASVCFVLLAISSCSSTKQLTINTIEPSPVDFSNQIRKIGIVNNSQSSFVKSYSTRLEQLIVMEERWLAEKGTEAALTGLFDELAQDKRFDTVRMLSNPDKEIVDFGTRPNDMMWKAISSLCEENGVDAIFALASHDTDTQFTLKKTKIEQLDMLRDRSSVSGQEITLETLVENGWRIYDPKQRKLIDEFTSNDQIVATAKGVSSVDALQAIDHRKETLLKQSKSIGSSYAQRMQPQKMEIQREYFTIGSKKFALADDKIQDGAYDEAIALWKEEVSNAKPRLSGRACYNLAVVNEYKGNIIEAMNWATKSYDVYKQDETLDYINALEGRQAQKDVVTQQLAEINFID